MNSESVEGEAGGRGEEGRKRERKKGEEGDGGRGRTGEAISQTKNKVTLHEFKEIPSSYLVCDSEKKKLAKQQKEHGTQEEEKTDTGVPTLTWLLASLSKSLATWNGDPKKLSCTKSSIPIRHPDFKEHKRNKTLSKERLSA